MTASSPSASRLSAAISELEKALSALDQTVHAVNPSLLETSAPEPHPLPEPEYNPPSSVHLIFVARLTFLLSLSVVALWVMKRSIKAVCCGGFYFITYHGVAMCINMSDSSICPSQVICKTIKWSDAAVRPKLLSGADQPLTDMVLPA